MTKQLAKFLLILAGMFQAVNVYGLDINNKTDVDLTWSMFQGNPQHTGFYPNGYKPKHFKLIWQAPLVNLQDGKTGIKSFPSFIFPVVAQHQLFICTAPYMVFQKNFLAALDTETGQTLWSAPLITNYGPYLNAPTIDGNTLFLQTPVAQGNNVFFNINSYDLNTGNLLSSTTFAQQGTNSFPITPFQHVLYTGDGSNGILAYSESGDKLWSQIYQEQFAWTPAVDDRYVVGYRNLSSLEKPNDIVQSGMLEVLNRIDGSEAFVISDSFFKETDNWSNTATVLDSHASLAIVARSGTLGAAGHLTTFDLNSKMVKYVLTNDKLGGHASSYIGQPALAENTIYVPVDNQLVAINEENGKVLWRWTLPNHETFADSFFVSAPLVTYNLIFISDKLHTYALTLDQHRIAWQFPMGGYLAISPDKLFIAGMDGKAYAIQIGDSPN